MWLNCSPSGNPCDPDFSVRAFASKQQPVRLQGTISTQLFSGRGRTRTTQRSFWARSSAELNQGHTNELAGRILPGPRMSASGALALVKRVFCFVFCRLSVQNITHHMTKLYSCKDPKLQQHLTASFFSPFIFNVHLKMVSLLFYPFSTTHQSTT